MKLPKPWYRTDYTLPAMALLRWLWNTQDVKTIYEHNHGVCIRIVFIGCYLSLHDNHVDIHSHIVERIPYSDPNLYNKITKTIRRKRGLSISRGSWTTG